MLNLKNNFEELENLSEEERKYALEILKDIITKGTSKQYTEILTEDYEEIPVDIETFLRDPKYLGKGLVDDDGRFTVYDYWVNTLKQVFSDPLKPAQYNTLALTGAIGLGKSFVAVLCGLYELYRMLCLKDPYLHYNLQPIDKITFAFMNITLDASKGVAWDKLQQLVQLSPWFMSHGVVSGTTNVEWKPGKRIELIAGSLSRHILGRAVYFAFFDEISFIPNQDVEIQKQKAKSLINTASMRMKSRFMKGEYNPTLLVIASSKRTEQSYMETFIEQKKQQESKTTLVIDEPMWVIRPDKDSVNKFKVAIGNKFLANELLPLNVTQEQVDVYRARGYQIIDVPFGFYEDFRDDVDAALMDIAGISTSNTNRYFSGPRIQSVIDTKLNNLFTKDIIEVGNGKDDNTQYWDFINLSKLDRSLLAKPLYIHMDMSVSGDKTGIAGVWIKGKKPNKPGQPQSNDLYFQLAFAVAVKAPKGHQISFDKNRQFIYWLKENGFKIAAITTDTFQSVDTGQALASKGFNYSVVSVDRVDTDKICKPYQYFRSTIYEERFVMFNNKLLVDELIGLERNNNTGKVDHGPSGINSKDVADAVCGATWRASRDAEQFSYDYGESVDAFIDANEQVMITDKKQVSIAFEQELQELLGASVRQKIQRRQQDSNNGFTDFGLGKAQVLMPDDYDSKYVII